MKKNLVVSLLLTLMIAALVCVAAMNVFAEETDTETVPPCTEHTPGPAANCQSAQYCTVCNTELAPIDPDVHSNPGPAPSCGTPQRCLACNVVIKEGLEHVWGAEPTCNKGQTCELCSVLNPEKPATGKHTADRDAATCTRGVSCKVCKALMAPKLGHNLGEEATCGKGQQCNRCHEFVENASGDCSLDWSKATVVRAATPNAFGIVKCACADCGTEVERAVAYSKTSQEAYAIAVGLTNVPADTTFHSTVKKVANFADVTVAKKYQLVQAMQLSLTDADDNAYSFADTVKVTILANNTVKKLNADCLKVYLLTDAGLEEISFTYTNEQKTLELDLPATGTVLIAANIKKANEILGN